MIVRDYYGAESTAIDTIINYTLCARALVIYQQKFAFESALFVDRGDGEAKILIRNIHKSKIKYTNLY